MTSSVLFDDDQPRVVISGVEALNGLGFNAHQTWALSRAELRAQKESPFSAWDGSPVTMGHIDVLPEDEFGAARLHQILTDLLKRWGGWLRGRLGAGRLAAGLAVSERFAPESTHPRFSKERLQLEGALREAMGGIAAQPRCELHPYGHGGAAYTIQWAGQLLRQGEADVVLVMGLDSAYDPDVVDGLLEREQLYLGGLDGRIPGEGGALLVLTTAAYAREQGLPMLAWLGGASVSSEPRYSAVGPNDGTVLSETVRALTKTVAERGGAVDWWYGDVSNEAYRVREFQLAFPRFSSGVSHAESVMEFIPTHFGDLGAATIPTAITIAVEAFSRDSTAARSCVAWASSHGATRGAVLVRRPEGESDA